MENKILLSICILSYNQPEEVRRLLESIKNQITSEVEVFIRDDSSNENTKFLIEDYKKLFSIRYVRGEKEGIDKTVIYLVREAKGKFIWWMGDDVIYPNAIDKVLRVIKERKRVNFIWANYNIFNKRKLAIEKILGDRPFKNINEIFDYDVTGLGFISATILRRKVALSSLKEAEKYIGSLFSNLFIVLYVIATGGENYFLRGPIVECHPTTPKEIKEIVNHDGVIKNRGFEVYGITFRNIFFNFFKQFGYWNLRKVIKKSFASLWRGMLVGWVGGWDTPKGKRWKMFKLYWSFPEFWIAIIPFLMPLWANKFLFKIYKIFFSHRKFIFGENLSSLFKKIDIF